MRRGRRHAARCARLAFVLALGASGVSHAQTPPAAEQKPAEPAEKPLGPGWLSLECCIGPLDNAIANGKGALEKAIGINISGYLDTGYTWSSNHPKSPANISGMVGIVMIRPR